MANKNEWLYLRLWSFENLSVFKTYEGGAIIRDFVNWLWKNCCDFIVAGLVVEKDMILL